MPVLTVPAIRKYRPQAERREIRDTLAPCLLLVIQPSGRRSWAMRFRRPDGRGAKLTLGSYADGESGDEPVLGAALTLRQARQLANRIDAQRALGRDVIADHLTAKARVRTAAVTAASNTFGAAVREFFISYKTRHGTRPRRWRRDARTLGLDWPGALPSAAEPKIFAGGVTDRWRDKPLSTIDGHDVHQIVDEARKHGIGALPFGPGRRRAKGTSDDRGRALHSVLSTLFQWLLRHRRIAVNPCAGVWRPAAPPARERALTEGEIVKVWRAADAVGRPYGAVVQMLLLTGCRRAEVGEMRRSEISENGATWTIPGARTKNHKAHVVPLPPLARAIVARVPRIEGKGDFVFTRDGHRAINRWSADKADLDEWMTAMPSWRLHDLRRTFVTGLIDLGIAPHVVEMAVNHTSGHKAGVAGIYNKSELLPERRAALERWATHISCLLSGGSGRVIPLKPGKKA